MNGFLTSGVFNLPLNEAAARKKLAEQGQRKKEKTLGAKLARESAARRTERVNTDILALYTGNPDAGQEPDYSDFAEKIKKGGR